MDEASHLSRKWTRLQDLLCQDSEFEARNPEAYELLFGREPSVGIYLPTFGVRILGGIPQSFTVRRSELRGVENHEGGFADAYSVQGPIAIGSPMIDPWWPHSLEVPAPPERPEQEITVTGRFPPVYHKAWFSPGGIHMRSLLLAIMSRDELRPHGIGSGTLNDRALYEAPPVRITDLRLAGQLLQNLKQTLPPIIETLPRPITPQNTIQWKRQSLSTLVNEWDHEESDPRWNDIQTVTFTAAAICLFLDLGMPELENMSSLLLTGQVMILAEEIHKLTKRLDKSAGEVERLIAGRSAGRPERPDAECLLALSCYRMGYPLRFIAEKNNIKPFDANDSRGTKSWRKRVDSILVRGVQVERELFPQASAIFEKEHDPEVMAKAEKAYRAYSWAPPSHALTEAGEAVGVDALAEHCNEIVVAYILLGSCKYHNVPPFPRPHE